MTDMRPNPEDVLKITQRSAARQQKKGQLKIFFGYVAGSGKTYAMLEEALELQAAGIEVLIGYVEPHPRPETMRLAEQLPQLPLLQSSYKGLKLAEFDLDAALERAPQVLLVDELAHTNHPGSRNEKRYQDVEELLEAGIDVYTTVNVQHLESLKDTIEQATQVAVQETIPDRLLEEADMLELIDVDTTDLLQRLQEGKIYSPDKIKYAKEHFFSKSNLRFLRESGMRTVADRIHLEQKWHQLENEKTSQRKIVVCVSSNPNADKIIRWGARLAHAFHAKWEVVFVETREPSETASRWLEKERRLCESLGGKWQYLKGKSVAQTVGDYANLTGTTDIIIGKNKEKGWRDFFKRDLEDELLEIIRASEIHIVADAKKHQAIDTPAIFSGLLRKFQLSVDDTTSFVVVMLTIFVASWGLYQLVPNIAPSVLLFVLAELMLAVLTRGYFYTMLGAVVGVLFIDYFFTEPLWAFKIQNPIYIIVLLMMLLISGVVSFIIHRMQQLTYLATEREHRLGLLYDLNQKLLAAQGLKAIMQTSLSYIGELFEMPVMMVVGDGQKELVFQKNEVQGTSAFFDTKEEKSILSWVMENKKSAGTSTDTLNTYPVFYQPILVEKQVLGVVGISCEKKALSQENRSLLKIFVSAIAIALQKQAATNEQAALALTTEREKVKSNLLRSISHDLRTPLTSISGSAATLLENSTLTRQRQTILLSGIRSDALWLNRIVENLLAITKLSDGPLALQTQPELMDEIIMEAVGRVKNRYPEISITIENQGDVQFVAVDATLIVQVLVNILENAVTYAPSKQPIAVLSREKQNGIEIRIVDHGPGIPASELASLFTGQLSSTRAHKGDSYRGMGIGLSLCRTIMEAHGGTIHAQNQPAGGACFTLWIPFEKMEVANKWNR